MDDAYLIHRSEPSWAATAFTWSGAAGLLRTAPTRTRARPTPRDVAPESRTGPTAAVLAPYMTIIAVTVGGGQGWPSTPITSGGNPVLTQYCSVLRGHHYQHSTAIVSPKSVRVSASCGLRQGMTGASAS